MTQQRPCVHQVHKFSRRLPPFPTRDIRSVLEGTDGSNPVPSSKESANFRFRDAPAVTQNSIPCIAGASYLGKATVLRGSDFRRLQPGRGRIGVLKSVSVVS